MRFCYRNGRLFRRARALARCFLGMIVALTLVRGMMAQTKPPLTLEQVRKLISISAPDATVAREIETRGIAFVPTPETLNRLRQQRAGPKTLRALENLISRLDEAREKIPTLLEILYKELDQGSRATLSGLVFKELLDDANRLDQICPPFAYQAHQVESITEAQRNQFTVRVHFLSKDFKERVYELEFAPVGENLMLRNLQALEEPLRPDLKQQAADVARRVAFAVCAGRTDVLAQVATPGLLSAVANARDRNQSGWGLFAKCGSSPVQMASVRTQDYSGIKVHASFTGLGANNLEVLVDLVENSWKAVAVKSGQRVAQDPDLRAYTLARFGVSPPPEAAGAAAQAGGLPVGTAAGEQGSDPAAQVQTFAVGHRHKTLIQNLKMSTTFCYGNLIVGPGNAVSYICDRPDTDFNRCENGRFDNIKEIKFLRDGALRISLKRGGNWDFSGDAGELDRANRAIQALPALP